MYKEKEIPLPLEFYTVLTIFKVYWAYIYIQTLSFFPTIKKLHENTLAGHHNNPCKAA